MDAELESKLRQRRETQCPTYDMSTPTLSPRQLTEVRHVLEAAVPFRTASPSKMKTLSRGVPLQVRQATALGLVSAFILYFALSRLWWVESDVSEDSNPGYQKLNKFYEEKLKNIAKGIPSLDGLSEIVVKADETYEDVYHNQLVQYAREARDPSEADWNGFVQEARQTGPVFMAGKEKLRDAVANMQRLIRRAPEHLRNMVQWLSKHNAEEASWYLNKVVKLVDSVHKSMEEAADQFANADASMGGMMRDAKENADRFEMQASSLEGEVKALEEAPIAESGRWSRDSNKAFYGCQLEALRLSLVECKARCIHHESGSCNRVTYYKMTSRNNCYLHCETSSPRSYNEADAYTLELGPSGLAAELQRKARAVDVAVGLKSRWQSIRTPLREVTQLVRRFRAATADLRQTLEDARFATDDLMAAFKPMQTEDLERREEKQMRILERQVEDVIAAIEDLGDSLAVLRFQR